MSVGTTTILHEAPTQALIVGGPQDELTDVGPMITSDAAERPVAIIEASVAAGARLRHAGRASGNLVTPTELEGTPASSASTCQDVPQAERLLTTSGPAWESTCANGAG